MDREVFFWRNKIIGSSRMDVKWTPPFYVSIAPMDRLRNKMTQPKQVMFKVEFIVSCCNCTSICQLVFSFTKSVVIAYRLYINRIIPPRGRRFTQRRSTGNWIAHPLFKTLLKNQNWTKTCWPVTHIKIKAIWTTDWKKKVLLVTRTALQKPLLRDYLRI